MPLTYAIADLHGRYDLRSEAVTKIVEHSKSARPATIITLGDYVNRGPQSRQVIERLMDWGSPDLKLVCLKGNHEDIMWQCCRLLWKIYKGADQRGHGARHVVHGHHQFRDGPVTIEGRTNLDTQAWYTGRLVIGVFDDEVAGGPVSLLEVHGEPVENIV